MWIYSFTKFFNCSYRVILAYQNSQKQIYGKDLSFLFQNFETELKNLVWIKRNNSCVEDIFKRMIRLKKTYFWRSSFMCCQQHVNLLIYKVFQLLLSSNTCVPKFMFTSLSKVIEGGWIHLRPPLPRFLESPKSRV